MSTAVYKISPMPWSRDELNNIYDADGMMIFEAKARNDGVGVMVENEGNAEFVVLMSQEATSWEHEQRLP
jgi:hypothetical protein